MRNCIRIVACSAGLLAAAHANATVVTIGTAKDAMIFGTSAGLDTGNAAGKAWAFFAGADGGGNRKRALMQFDVASAGIPAGATVTGVTLTLHLGQIAGSGGGSAPVTYPSRTLRLYDLLQDWTEGPGGTPVNPINTSNPFGGVGQGSPKSANDVTWDYAHYDPINPTLWSTQGGTIAPNESAESTFTTFTVNAPYIWSSPSMVADVQAWLDGTKSNDGWLLKSDLETSATSFLGFYTREGGAAMDAALNADLHYAPALSITYAVPEPAAATLAITAVALAASSRRRPKHA